jgi:inositol phosphorylceramide mannosyltransferase catalytic subunit
MRSRIIFTIVLLLVTLLFLVSPTVKFPQIFFEHSGIALTQNEVAAAHSATVPDARQQVIPKIIHQVFHDWRNDSMPADWEYIVCIVVS